ncbi:MAG: type II secretion system protein [Desulfobacteraceae bacterium]|nr:MAG: type II secretion system protein [Desulfobacteraceae bacterium]
MRRHAGFTLIELMVVVAILGILGATAMPILNIYQQRAYGSEAALMLKRILDAEIMYFLENEKFFPEDGTSIDIFKDDPPTKQEIQDVKDALNIPIPVGHHLNFQIQTFPATADGFCQVTISASFNLFKDGVKQIYGTVDSEGKITIF